MKNNGRYCKSGMATQLHPNSPDEAEQKIAMCTTTSFIQEAIGQRNGVHLEFGSPNHVDQFDIAVELNHPY
jgi:hypothetical protein